MQDWMWGLRSTFICVVDVNGTQVHESEVASDADAISGRLSAETLLW